MCVTPHAFAEEIEEVTIETDFLRVTILPKNSGRMVSIYDKQRNIEHFESLEETVDAFSPLVPPRITSNQAGIKDWFWKQQNPARVDFHLHGKGEDETGPWVEVSGTTSGLDIVRRITLLKSKPAVQVDVYLRSKEKQTLSYWLHTLMAEEIYLDKTTGNGWIAGTFSEDLTPRQGRGMFAVPHPGIQKMETPFGDFAFAPAGNWFARLAVEQPFALAILTEDAFIGSEGFYYTWQDSTRRIVTLETIWPPMEIVPGQATHLRFLLVVIDTNDPKEIAKRLNSGMR